MSSSRDGCEDWVARARRGGLSAAEHRQFRELLESSLEARLLYEASCAFDRDSCVVAGDDARLERIARRLQQRQRRHQRWVPVRTLSLGVAAGLLVAGVAVGAVSYSKVLRAGMAPAPVASAIERVKVAAAARSAVASVEPAPVVAPSQPDEASVESTGMAESTGLSHIERLQAPMLPGDRTPVAATRPLASIPAAAPSVEPLVPPRTGNHATGRFDDVVEVPVPATSALSLFTEANRARVQGDTAVAVARYERLISEFALSRVALVARISLGMLYLQQGRARQALEQFQTYASSSGPLMAEALWGEAQASRALGQRAHERGALQRIVQEYPQSAYAGAAQSRLIARE